ncbi:PREDICTED: sperm-associated antigen 7 homolog isoform X1 [Amphimedon queenslandica]|uniref:R3H domain-containing protein n=1 Tax=Amphimedon queenslandica TaxID=400682 RepID=A0AAN0J5Y9_AMPQE|nr:PREDICTED: sperm-associated antigen 7 homolog isoform X1 [Amphimedon queenslandica]|eukprot:XP_019852148.1 PREDICTED: sperm-associated antigen 7 homolog isoform X1 [Amphimedon queenslandica]
MDLLGTILNKMDGPPPASEKEKKEARDMRSKIEREQRIEKSRREAFRKNILTQIGVFLEDGTKKRVKFSPMDKIMRSIVHEVAETAGVIAYSFGSEEVDRHVVLFKKEHAPSDEELHALRNGEVYSPTSVKPTGEGATPLLGSTGQTSSKPVGPVSNYRDKYKHLISTEISEPAPLKPQPERNFGFVPSSNKRDVRSIEETLIDLRTKKKAKLEAPDDS